MSNRQSPRPEQPHDAQPPLNAERRTLPRKVVARVTSPETDVPPAPRLYDTGTMSPLVLAPLDPENPWYRLACTPTDPRIERVLQGLLERCAKGLIEPPEPSPPKPVPPMSTRHVRFLKIGLAQPTRIRSWASRTMPNGDVVGRVTKAETINYRTLKPEMDGLFCERIFGPAKDWECHCGRTKGQDASNPDTRLCPHCGVEVMESKVRRHRMGYIELVYPVVHVWYLKSIPSYLSVLLDRPKKDVEAVVYCNRHISGHQPISLHTSVCYLARSAWGTGDEDWTHVYRPGVQQYLGEAERMNSMMEYATPVSPSLKDVGLPLWEDPYQFSIGAQAIARQLRRLKLRRTSHQLSRKLRRIHRREARYGVLEDEEMKEKARIVRRLQLIHHFRMAEAKPEWMVLKALPVLPPELRPIVQLDGGRFATADLNDLYRRVLNRNNRFFKLHSMVSPETLIRSEKRLLQEAVDALLDNGKRGRPVKGTNNRPLKSLADTVKGKQGRFRQNLLGKRVDYSGRSVIVVGPKLRLHQCGLPREMAIELFQPFLIQALMKRKVARNIRVAKKLIRHAATRGAHSRCPSARVVWSTLAQIVQGHPVLLNRAPTLHRLGIQAFDPVLIDGRAIRLHPLVCPAFNADFDGDQMAVHVPLCNEARAEARVLMLSSHNLLSPATGQPILVPSQDMVLGWYYLTTTNPAAQPADGHYFSDLNQVEHAYHQGQVSIHSVVWVRWAGRIESVLGDTREEMPLEVRVAPDGTSLHIYSSVQMRCDAHGRRVCQFVRTTPGRVILNQLVQRFVQFKKHEEGLARFGTRIPDAVLPAGVVRTGDPLTHLLGDMSLIKREQLESFIPAYSGLTTRPILGPGSVWPPVDPDEVMQIQQHRERLGYW